MLAGLLLTDFAIAKKTEIAFSSNLVLITGETGAGKTIIMRAISAACGSAINNNVIRTGSEKAQIEASFTLNDSQRGRQILEKYDLLDEENIVILTRTVYNNRTRAGINGHFVSVKALGELGSTLIDMLGQHAVQSLLNKDNHIHILDRFGGKELLVLSEQVRHEVLTLKEITAEITELTEKDRKYKEERDFIDFEIAELDKANLVEGETEELQKKEKILANAQELSDLILESHSIISQNEGGSILDLLDKLLFNISKASKIAPSLLTSLERIESLRAEIKDMDMELVDFSGENLRDPEELSEIEERLSLLSTLTMKYRRNVSELISYFNELKGKAGLFNSLSDKIDNLQKKKKIIFGKLKIDASNLSKMRYNAAEKFRKQVVKELKDLAMENADFKVYIESIEDKNGISIDGKKVKIFSSGIDSVKFLIAPNVGEDFKDLASIASGGELSRIMLAIKRVIANIDEIPTLAFDEVDAGIGGKTGEKVAEKLLEISHFRQVICITHLPQIASLPGEHFVVEKEVKNKETFLNVKKLTDDERVNEIARMISGSNITETTINQAKELLRRWI